MSHRSSLHIALSVAALALIAGLAPAQAQADTQPLCDPASIPAA